MDSAGIWPTIHSERRALAEDLASLDDAAWDTPSLCDGWTVRDVLAHMAGTARITPPLFVAKLVAAGFSLTRLQRKDVAALRGATPADTLQNFRAIVESSKHPPGPTDTWLGESIVHAEDIRRPLGIAHTYPSDALVRVADFYKGSNLIIGAKKRIDGVCLRATDCDWSHGEGPEAAGPMLSLLMVIAGRRAALDDLAGDGVTVLAAR